MLCVADAQDGSRVPPTVALAMARLITKRLMRVSLCLIVRDESANLGACLDSAAGLADETIVVDTGSTDDTREIALRRGARVHEFPWCDDFAAARNEALRHATGDWILSLDADDRIVPVSHSRLKRLLATLDGENIGYLMRVVSPAPDGGPLFDVFHPRLFRRRDDVRWKYCVHEQIGPSIQRSGGRLDITDIAILHTGYLRGVDIAAKLQRNLRLMDKELERSPFDGFMLGCRGGTLVDLGRAAEALVSLSLCEAAYPLGSAPPDIYVNRARAHGMERDLIHALGAVREGLARYATDARLRFLEAEICAALGDYEAAVQSLRSQMLVHSQHSTFSVGDHSVAGFRARHLLAQVLLEMHMYDEAADEARLILKDRPAYGNGWLTLAEALAAVGGVAAMREVTARCPEGPEASIVRLLLDAIRLRRADDPGAALEALQEIPEPVFQSSIVQCERALALFANGIRGLALDQAVECVLVDEPFSVRAWAIKRASQCLQSPGVHRVDWSQPACSALGGAQ